MNKIKEKFEEWLLKQGLAEKTKSGRLSTIYNYTNTIDKICKKSFKINDEVGWHYLAENIYQELARFYELSNKDYFLDAISIRYALFYFQKVSNFIYSKLKADENNNVNLYLNFKNTDYLILATKLNELFQYALLFDTLVFGRKHHQITLNQENENHFLKNLDNILYHIIYPKIGDKSQLKHHIMLHISYSKKHLRKEKTALLKYHNFLYPSQNVLENQLLYMVAKANPERRIGGNYIVKREVSGSSCMVLDFNDNNNLETDDVDIHMTEEDERCVLIKEEMPEIFNVSYNSVEPIIKKFKSFTTPRTTYYSIDSANKYLEKGFHVLKTPNDKVDYTHKGYDYWAYRSLISNKLNISHNCFDKCVNYTNCTYISYCENKPQYYVPDIDFLSKNSQEIRRAQHRKLKYKNN